jgi:hypothetical protein
LPLGGLVVAAGLVWWGAHTALLPAPQRDDMSTYGAFALALVALLVSIFHTVGAGLRPGSEPGLDQLTNSLATSMRSQWTQAATERRLREPAPLPIRWCLSSAGVASPPAAAVAPGGPFTPLPGIDPVTEQQLRAGAYRQLHQIYGGLTSGRLIIVGGPGTGKSSAAILLLLDALRYREQAAPEHRAQIPVPVLFTLQNWNPGTTSVDEWFVAKLGEIPLLRGTQGRDRATTLLRAGRIAVFLDGLDEIPEEFRATALEALSRKAQCRLVLMTRTAELAEAAQQHTLTSALALDLRPLTAADAAGYLLKPLVDPAPRPWRTLTTDLVANPGSVAARALTNPLTITLVRDIYPTTPAAGSPVGPVDELLDTARFPDPDAITNHLLDEAIAAAYSRRLGSKPRYTSATAHRTLSVIAFCLRDNNTRDLAWWRVPLWVPGVPRVAISFLVGLVIGALLGLVGGLIAGPVLALPQGFQGFLLGGAIMGCLFGGMSGKVQDSVNDAISKTFLSVVGGLRDNGLPTVARRFSWKSGSAVLFGLAGGIPGGVGLGVLFGPLAGAVFGLVGAVIFGLVWGLEGEPEGVLGPLQVRRANLTFGLIRWPAMILVLGTVVLVIITPVEKALILADRWLGLTVNAMVYDTTENVEFGLLAGLIIGVIAGLTRSAVWTGWISQLYLRGRVGLPINLMRFLEDARTRGLLRTIGPIYQFRHATLQDRLAGTTNHRSSPNKATEPSRRPLTWTSTVGGSRDRNGATRRPAILSSSSEPPSHCITRHTQKIANSRVRPTRVGLPTYAVAGRG